MKPYRGDLKGLVRAGLLAAAAWSGMASTVSAGPIPVTQAPASGLPVQNVYVFGKDDRVALPRKLDHLKYKIGLIFSANTRHGCTASCVARDVILTAAHCVLSKSKRGRRVETAGVKFVLPSKHLKGQYIVADVLHKADFTPRNVVSGFPVTRAQAGRGRSEDWAFVKLSRKACRYGALPIRALSNRALAKASKTGKLMEVAFHGDRDYGKTLLYTNKCRLVGRKGKSVKRLIRHRCDLTSGASGSPLLVDPGTGPEIVAVNVAEFATQRYLRRGRKIIKYYKKKPSYNVAINASVFLKKLQPIADLDVVTTKSALARIQLGLQHRRLYRGKIDGVFGPATWNALRQYERGQKRSPLGLPSTVLLKELEERPARPQS